MSPRLPAQGLTVVGAGWLGRALAGRLGSELIRQRDFRASTLESASGVIVASGVSRLEPGDLAATSAKEGAEVRNVLESAAEKGIRCIVLGSSDVCGLAVDVRGDTPVAPVTAYGELKALREQVVRESITHGADAVAVRLAPVHGPGKAQTIRMVGLARRSAVPMVRGGRYSIGFVTLHDVVESVRSLVTDPFVGVCAVGAGPTPFCDLIRGISHASGSTVKIVPVPVPTVVLRRMARSGNTRVAWFGRLGLDKVVHMETPHAPMSTAGAARYLSESVPPATR